MIIIPMHDKIVVKKLPEMTESGIVIPGTVSARRTDVGEVMAIGPGRRNEAGEIVLMTLKLGQKVLYLKGTGIQIEGDLILMHEAEVMGLVE